MVLTHQPSALHRLAVTTAVNDNSELINEAKSLALLLNAEFFLRPGNSIGSILENDRIDRVLIVRRDRYSLQNRLGDEYQFHPNLAIVRNTNYVKVGCDYYLEAGQFREGDIVIDCTLGFGCEAILAAMRVGLTGEVIGLESVPELAAVTRNGMSRYTMLQKPIEAAMRRVVVLNCNYREYLRRALTRSVDIVYFDPFFKETLEGSGVTVGALAAFGNRAPLNTHAVIEARRVVRRNVIIKHPKWHPLPDSVQELVTDVVAGKRSPVCFSLIPPYGG